MKMINGLLVVLIIFVVWRLLIAMMLPEPILKTQRNIEISPNVTMGQWQWFQSTNVASNKQNLEQANLNAQVMGVVIKGQHSVALIQLPGRSEKVYHIGDKINNTTSLESVEAHRIVLRETGVLRELGLHKLGSNNSSTNAIVRHTKSPSKFEAMALMDMARAVPVNIEGGTGLRLDDLSSEIQQLSELQSGDIILSVEGQDVMSLTTDNSWQTLMNKTDAQVNLIREGQSLTVQVNVVSLAQHMLQTLTN